MLAALAALLAGHQALLAHWTIDDAVISYTYARNVAQGYGLVAFPGGERVEGYSNPLWVAALVPFAWAGFDLFRVAKLLGWVVGSISLVYAWKLTVRARGGDRTGAWLGPLLLALDMPFATWGTSGLENAAFTLCLLAGIEHFSQERETGQGWGSVGWWGALTLVRPEGLAYLGVPVGLTLLLGPGALGYRGVAARLVGMAAPWLGWMAFRLAYYAWPLPNTYYAKLGTTGSSPGDWEGLGWRYLRRWADALGGGWLLPLALLGLQGRAGLWRVAACLGLVLAGLAALGAGPWSGWLDVGGEPDRTPLGLALLCLGLVLAPLGLTDRPGASARVGSGLAGLAALAFTVGSDGDWMQGWRFASLWSGPWLVLVATGCLVAADRVAARLEQSRSWGFLAWLLVGALPAWLGPLHLQQTLQFSRAPEDYPELIRRRIVYLEDWRTRLLLDRPTHLEMDLGAHLWWTDWEIVDVAGLVDAPVAHHTWRDKRFVEAYVFREHQLDFAHLHRGWAKTTDLFAYPEWGRMVPLPPYPDVHGLHDGVWLHRRHLFAPAGSGEPLAEADGLALRSLRTGGGRAEGNRALFVEVGVQGPADPFRLVGFLVDPAGQVAHSFEIPPVFDLVSPERWRKQEVGLSRTSVQLPSDLIPGDYRLGVVALRSDGTVVPWGQAEAPAFARGEVLAAEVVRVGPEGAAEASATEAQEEALALAESGDCSAAESAWWAARARVPRHTAFHERGRRLVWPALGRCWAGLSSRVDGPLAREHLVRARRFDPTGAEVTARGVALADQAEAEGDAALVAGRRQDALASWKDALRLDPARPWLRRRTEALRDALDQR